MHKRDEIPVQSVLSSLFADLGLLVRKEIALGQQEVKTKIARTLSGVIWVALGGLFMFGAFMAAIAGAISLVASYGYSMHASAFLCALALAIVGGILIVASKSSLTSGLMPNRMAANVSRDIHTIKEHAR